MCVQPTLYLKLYTEKWENLVYNINMHGIAQPNHGMNSDSNSLSWGQFVFKIRAL